MGRKVNYDEKPKKGPGRKARKQGDPVLPSKLKGKNTIQSLCAPLSVTHISYYHQYLPYHAFPVPPITYPPSPPTF